MIFPSYKTIRFEKCSVCFEDKSGVVIGNVYYRVCVDCLILAWNDQFSLHPETHPCRNTCVSCNTKDPKESMAIGGHIICQICLTKLLKQYIDYSFDANKCSFCGIEKQKDIAFVERADGKICQPCIRESFELLTKSENDSD